MIERYRDGVVPSATRRRRDRGRVRRAGRRGAGPHRRGRAHRRARRDLAAHQAAQPLRAGRGAVAARQGRRRGRSPRPGALHARRGAARGLRAAPPVHAGIGGAAAGGARAARTCRSTAPRWARPRAARRSASSASSSRASRPRRRPPEAEPVIDSHCHLDYCEPPVAELVGRARAAGVDRHGHRGHERRGDPARARGRRGPRRGGGDRRAAIPTRRPASTTLALEEIERAAAHPRVRAIGETGLDYYRDHAPREDQRRAFEAQLELAARAALPVVIHTRAAEDDTFAVLREHAGSVPVVVMHCFSAPDRLEECVERGYMCSFAGNVTYPKATDLQEAARQVPDELLLVETDSPVPGAAAGAREAERARERRAHRALRGGPARRLVRGARAHGGGELRARLRARDARRRAAGAEPRQASLRRLRAVRRPAEPRARPELPDRRQHPAA